MITSSSARPGTFAILDEVRQDVERQGFQGYRRTPPPQFVQVGVDNVIIEEIAQILAPQTKARAEVGL